MQNMQNNMQGPKPICRIVTRLYFAYSAYICTPHFADVRGSCRASDPPATIRPTFFLSSHTITFSSSILIKSETSRPNSTAT